MTVYLLSERVELWHEIVYQFPSRQITHHEQTETLEDHQFLETGARDCNDWKTLEIIQVALSH